MLLRNVVKPEDVNDPISVSGCALLRVPLHDLNSRPLLVEEILARTQTERLMKIYDLPTILLDTGVPDHARVEHGMPPQSQSHLTFLSHLQNLSKPSFFHGGTPDILAAARQVLID